ncbi:MAG TPA: HAMP domain-containing sensor histidine kinase [Candidatus Binataceae bacterium]|nr:HAMP domain-containing sensor histidine kinase [Candidatus Binataceae bacterium]
MRFPALNLKGKLIALITVLLAMTLGAQMMASFKAQEAIISTTQEKVKDLASVIQISVQELTSIAPTDPELLQNYVEKHDPGLEVSIASSKDLIINSSNPKLIGAELNPEIVRALMQVRNGNPDEPVSVPASLLGLNDTQSTVYFIPVAQENHLLGYVQVVADFNDFNEPLRNYQYRLIVLGAAIFVMGVVFAYVLAQRYVTPIHTVAYAAQNIADRGLEPVPEERRRDEIGLLTRSFNEMVAQLRRARERELELNRLERFTALGQLAGALAHEIKNPLNFISLALDQLRAHYSPQLTRNREDFMRQLKIMKDEIHRLSEMVQTFLHYGQPIEIHPTPTDVRGLVSDVLALSDSKLRSQRIDVVEQDDGSPAMLNLDAEKVRTCFVNVVANATQAMPDGGKLKIEFARNNGRFVLSFADTGKGIEPEYVEHVFEPFFTTKREGIGLGLFFSKAIVEKHGGTITIGSNPEPPGTTVTFSFPFTGVNSLS